MRKPEAVSRSRTGPRLRAAPHAIDTKPKLLFVTPIVTFLAAGLAKLVPLDWNIGWQGIALLVGFAIVGACLQCIPRRSVLWRAEPGSSQATLKQTITTMRVLVSIVMVLVPVTILATNDKVLSVLPPSVEKYVGLTMVVMGWAGRGFYVKGFRALWHRVPDMTSLVAVGTMAAFAYSLIATAEPILRSAFTT